MKKKRQKKTETIQSKKIREEAKEYKNRPIKETFRGKASRNAYWFLGVTGALQLVQSILALGQYRKEAIQSIIWIISYVAVLMIGVYSARKGERRSMWMVIIVPTVMMTLSAIAANGVGAVGAIIWAIWIGYPMYLAIKVEQQKNNKNNKKQ